jgi:hypothetical protein
MLEEEAYDGAFSLELTAESHRFGAAPLRQAHGERSARVEVLANFGANLPVRELVSGFQGAHP